MNDDTTINRVSIKHAYQQVADAIAARIAANHYPCKLPRELHLAEEFGVSHVTVRHAMAILRERGLIVSIHGRGTFIASESAGNQSEDVEPLSAYRGTRETRDLDEQIGYFRRDTIATQLHRL